MAAGRTMRKVLELAVRRLSRSDSFVGNPAAEITVPREIANKGPVAAARTEILKAVAMLRNTSRH